jgi:HD-GYP domain-containing protein (c-di-GMP phosphodiesterase class II)
MTNRLSNNATSRDEALKKIEKQAGSKSDLDIVEIFIKMILDDPKG